MRKLTGWHCDFNFLANLKDLRLEYFEHLGYQSGDIKLNFLKQLTNLKFLRLRLWKGIDEVCDMIWELKNLECLELDSCQLRLGENLNNLHKLEKLKKLKASRVVCSNILDHMKFGVFQNLEELDAYFEGASVASIREMKRIAPNLKKIKIHSAPPGVINVLKKTLQNLEVVS